MMTILSKNWFLKHHDGKDAFDRKLTVKGAQLFEVNIFRLGHYSLEAGKYFLPCRSVNAMVAWIVNSEKMAMAKQQCATMCKQVLRGAETCKSSANCKAVNETSANLEVTIQTCCTRVPLFCWIRMNHWKTWNPVNFCLVQQMAFG